MKSERYPRQASTLNHTGFRLCQSEAQLNHAHLQDSRWKRWEPHKQDTDVAAPQPNITDNDNPLSSPQTLQVGAQSLNMKHDQHNVNRKFPNDESVAGSQGQMLDSTASRRSKPELQIKVPQKHTGRPILTGPLLYDKSVVYIHSSPVSNGGRITCAFGAIGDQRSPRRGPSSAPSAYGSSETPQDRVPATAGHCRALPSHDPFTDENALRHNLELSTIATCDGLSIAHSGQTSPQTQGPFTTRQLDYPTLHDLVDESTPDFDQYELLLVDETGLRENTISPCRAAFSKRPGRTRRRRFTTDLRKVSTPSTRNMEGIPKTSKSCQEPAYSNSSSSKSPSPITELTKSESIVAPMWRRSGPSFASSFRPSGTLSQSAPTKSRMSCSAPENGTSNGNIAFQDPLDPEEFCLPYGVSPRLKTYQA